MREYLPKAAQRNRPDPVPVILLGQLAIDQDHQGQGYAGGLLRFALATALRFSREIGCFGVITHPLNDAARAFYQRFGFAALPGDPRHSMIIRLIDLERSGF